MYWEGEKECISREAVRQLQLERLQATVLRVYMNVPFYRKKFDTLGIDPDSFRSLEDVSKLPFTSKDDLRVSYPYGMFAVPLREVVRVQASSGTTGMPTAVGYTRNDIKSWSNLAARILAARFDQLFISLRVYPTAVGIPVVPEDAWTLTTSRRGTANMP